MLKFSPANAKLKNLVAVPGLQKYLANKRKVFSCDKISGHSCPFAEKCLSKVVVTDGKRKVQDGPKTEFRCFSASQEATFTNTYNRRMENFEALKGLNLKQTVEILEAALPHNLGVCRIDVAGDFMSPAEFGAWIELARNHSDRLFYAYTKSLPYWVKQINRIPENLTLTASYGGKRDDLIAEYNLRNVVVVKSEQEAAELGREIDHDDSHAALPGPDFALLVHGIQPKGSEYAEAVKLLKKQKVQFSYPRK
jgi:hypothetical protein